MLSSGQPHTYRSTPQLSLYHSDNRGYRADSYGQTSPIDSPSSTAPALELTNIHDYSQQFEQDSWTVSCTLLIISLYVTILMHSFRPIIVPWPACISFPISTSHARITFFYPRSQLILLYHGTEIPAHYAIYSQRRRRGILASPCSERGNS